MWDVDDDDDFIHPYQQHIIPQNPIPIPIGHKELEMGV